ncbi:YHYH protein [Parvularcula marina]|uniref:YHYH protein n=1 Tax=Parvularcula marina TaxID=2292771 RepID=UPI003512BED3
MPILDILIGALMASHPISAELTEAAVTQPGGGRPPRLREHTAVQRGELELVPATEDPIAPSWVEITEVDDERVIRSNSISRHKTGKFPNPGNPNRITEQNVEYRVPLEPVLAEAPVYYQLGTFGVALNGVVLEPQAAEWYLGQAGSEWQYDPLGAAVPLGLDAHKAHVQPQGLYHYHGLPEVLPTDVDATWDKPLGEGEFVMTDLPQLKHVGWALDGYPIYIALGYGDRYASAWVLRNGERPSGDGEPGGYYDGTFLADYRFAGGTRLNECNAAYEDLGAGMEEWAYFLTDTFPYIPRCFIGEPIDGAIVMDAEGRMRGRPRR